MQGTPASLQLKALLAWHAPNKLRRRFRCLGVQVELMVARWTNWPPIPPFAWQRGLVGMLLGALPHAFEGLLGFLIDYADGDGYYSNRRMQRFQQRHPGEQARARDSCMHSEVTAALQP